MSDDIAASTPTDDVVPPPAPVEETPPPPAPTPVSKRQWYVVKVQSGREDSIKANLERRIKLDNLEEFVGQIVIPIEKITEVREGKKRVKKLKKYPGYLFCEVEYNEHVQYLFRETSGVGDFVGGSLTRLPQPMSEKEVQRMLSDQEPVGDKKSGEKAVEDITPTKGRIKLDYDVGDTVKVREGMFANMEGPVTEIADRDSPTPKVRVTLTIWGRPVPVDLEYWQVDPM
jgi:transcriptional antiterminator NusG